MTSGRVCCNDFATAIVTGRTCSFVCAMCRSKYGTRLWTVNSRRKVLICQTSCVPNLLPGSTVFFLVVACLVSLAMGVWASPAEAKLRFVGTVGEVGRLRQKSGKAASLGGGLCSGVAKAESGSRADSALRTSIATWMPYAFLTSSSSRVHLSGIAKAQVQQKNASFTLSALFSFCRPAK